ATSDTGEQLSLLLVSRGEEWLSTQDCGSCGSCRLCLDADCIRTGGPFSSRLTGSGGVVEFQNSNDLCLYRPSALVRRLLHSTDRHSRRLERTLHAPRDLARPTLQALPAAIEDALTATLGEGVPPDAGGPN